MKRGGSRKLRRCIGRCWKRAPGHADARHLLGVVALHSGRHAAAVDLIESAIAADRVLLYGSSTHRAHLSIFHQIDVALDPFPQNGDASTGEALWMGVPVVSLCGSSVASREGAAMSSYVGLRKFVAMSGDAYVRVAVETGADLPRLARLRSELRTMWPLASMAIRSATPGRSRSPTGASGGSGARGGRDRVQPRPAPSHGARMGGKKVIANRSWPASLRAPCLDPSHVARRRSPLPSG